MRLTVIHRRRQRRRLVALAVFALLAAPCLLYSHASSNAAGPRSLQQRRRPRAAGPTRGTQARRPRAAINYSRFLHDQNHVRDSGGDRTANCNDCHKLSSPLQYDIKDYPDHPSCVNCHRQQFFTGARPAICTVCHQVSGPRNEQRFDFPKQGRDVTREFPGRFPHGLHQDLLAQLGPSNDPAREVRLFRASFMQGAAETRAEENCATCHGSYDKTKKEEAGFFPDERWPENMLRGVGTFRKIPEGPEGHRTCFVCHTSSDKGWQSPLPLANDCAGCHSRTATGNARPGGQEQPAATTTGAQMSRGPSPPMRVAFSSALLPSRKVFNFQHDGGGRPGEGGPGSHDMGCTVCHINITQEQSFIVRPDVPISSCAICHIAGGRKSSLRKGTDTTITTEMDDWIKSRKACLSCHTAEYGAKPPPCSHYYADKRVPPSELQCR